MRTAWKVAALTIPLALGACGRRESPTVVLTDDLKQDLAAASAAGDLATAPQSYQRMRFVSDVEQRKASEPAKRPKVSRSHIRPTVSNKPAEATAPDVAPEPQVATVSESPAPTVQAPMPEPEVIAQRPSPEPAPAPAGTVGDGGMGERRRNGGIGGLGGLLGGIIGSVVIRGGHGGVDKCDPRTDGRGGRPPIFDRPDFGMPLPTGRTFPSRR